jgi:FKBP-type peptidyl-prolyl cis-trans isomerase FkpA
MANNNSQRVAAFLLALLFLLTTVGAAGYVIYQLNAEDSGLVNETDDVASEQEPPVQEDSIVGQTIENFNPPYEITEVRFDDIVVGEGEEVLPSDTVTINYTGALASDGTIFDSSVGGEPATFPLDNLIVGWQEGIPGMKVGGVRRLYIPAAKGYGEAGSGESIPPNSDLIFDIELFNTTR